ncbi:MAG TPA: hypothetical protein VLR49_13660 [Ferruginibacter sp.]|nr:hypothetical protein [Ferruginibacter sp.]
MSEAYSIEIPNEKLATYRVVTFIIAIINLLAFGYIIFYSNDGAILSLLYIGFIVSLLALILFIIKHYGRLFKSFRIEIAFLISGCIWLISANYLVGVLILLFAFLGLIANKKPVIYFTKEQIRYPSFPEKIFLWPEVDFVILKDDILTIELKNNQLFQFTLEKKVANGIDAVAFNLFCNQQLIPGDS